MKDRIPTYPGRVKIVPVEGQTNVYDMTRADNPTQDGTPICKRTLLTDATAALYGGDETMLPDDVLQIIHQSLDGRVRIAAGTYIGTGTYGEAYPCTLTFPFFPKFVYLFKTPAIYAVTGALSGASRTDQVIIPSQISSFQVVENIDGSLTNVTNQVTFSEADNSISWYTSSRNNAAAQMNKAEQTYGYFAIGGGIY